MGLPDVPRILILTRLLAVGGSGVISTLDSLIAALDSLQLSHVKALQLSAPKSTTARHRLNRAECIVQWSKAEWTQFNRYTVVSFQPDNCSA